MKLVVGLGNPGRAYVGTRHNIGFEVVDRSRPSSAGCSPGDFDRLAKTKFDGLAFDGVVGRQASEKLVLLKPTTYMNLSGQVGAGGDGVLPARAGRHHDRPGRPGPAVRQIAASRRRESRRPQRPEGHRAGAGDATSTRGCGSGSTPPAARRRDAITCSASSRPSSES